MEFKDKCNLLEYHNVSYLFGNDFIFNIKANFLFNIA